VIVAIESHQGALDMQISTIGLDIAKNVFQVHGIDAAEKVVVRKRLRRRQVLEFFQDQQGHRLAPPLSRGRIRPGQHEQENHDRIDSERRQV